MKFTLIPYSMKFSLVLTFYQNDLRLYFLCLYSEIVYMCIRACTMNAGRKNYLCHAQLLSTCCMQAREK